MKASRSVVSGALILPALLLSPLASADVVLLGGLAILHEAGDPGISSNAGAGLRVDPERCAPPSTCVAAYGNAGPVVYETVMGGLGPVCQPNPSDCFAIHLAAAGRYTVLAVYHDANVRSLCTWHPQDGGYVCASFAVTPAVGPEGAVLCVGVGVMPVWYQVPPMTCEGLLLGTSPPCLRRASDGFEFVCQHPPGLP